MKNLKKLLLNKYLKKKEFNFTSGDFVSILFYDDGNFIKEFKGICLHFKKDVQKQISFFDMNTGSIFTCCIHSPTILNITVLIKEYKKYNKNNIKKILLNSREWDSNPRVQ